MSTSIKVPGRVEARGEFRLCVIRRDGSVKRDTGWFSNLILDQGLNRWGTGTIISGAAIGTGTSTPATTQTSLDAQATWATAGGTGHNTITRNASSPYEITRTFVYRTNLGALSGNYSEVSVGWATGASMFSRALIVDGGGSPTTVTVLSDEQLDIFYRLVIYPPLTDFTATAVDISGSSYDVIGRASQVTSWGVPVVFAGQGQLLPWNGNIGTIAQTPSGSVATSRPAAPTGTGYANNSYTATTYYLNPLTQSNLSGGIQSVSLSYGDGTYFASFQYQFNPKLPKDGTNTLRLDFSMTWARRP